MVIGDAEKAVVDLAALRKVCGMEFWSKLKGDGTTLM